jgi:hypothetical protein
LSISLKSTVLGPAMPRLDEPIAVALEDLVPQSNFY